MGFDHAWEGITESVKTEGHLRFHIMIAVLIHIFAYFYGIDRSGWAVLILTSGAVIAAELFNTALERAVDTATAEIVPTAKFAKDAAAGAVLVLAAVSVLVGIALFGDAARIWETLKYIFTTAKVLIPCLFAGGLLLIFVIYGGKNGK